MTNSWILNCIEKEFDVIAAFKDERILDEGMTWQVRNNLKKIQINDIFYLYLTDPSQEIIAKGRIVELPHRRYCDEISAQYWKNSKKDSITDRVWIEIDYRIEPRLTRGEINPDGTHPSLIIPIGNQGVSHLVDSTAQNRLSRMCEDRTIQTPSV